MNKCLSALILSLFCLTAYANQEAQENCIAEFSKQCQARCAQTTDANCGQNCQSDAVNQCREAGE